MTEYDIKETASLIARLWPNVVGSRWAWPDEAMESLKHRLKSIPITFEQAKAALVELHMTIDISTPKPAPILAALKRIVQSAPAAERNARSDEVPLLAPDLARSRIVESLRNAPHVLSDLADRWRGHNVGCRGWHDHELIDPTEKTRTACDNFLRWAYWELKHATQRERSREHAAAMGA